MGDDWVHLRLCMTCGHVGCCDNSKNKHATKHFHATQHPVIRSFEPGEAWMFCYVDDLFRRVGGRKENVHHADRLPLTDDRGGPGVLPFIKDPSAPT